MQALWSKTSSEQCKNATRVVVVVVAAAHHTNSYSPLWRTCLHRHQQYPYWMRPMTNSSIGYMNVCHRSW
jgi:hypothetical protein